MEKFVLLCIFLVGTFLKLSNGQVTCNNKAADFSCGRWKQSGFCTHSHVEYMRKNCMKSCGTCANPNPSVTCNNKDGDTNCNTWTNLGFCTSQHVAYMQKNCMKSCKQCGVVAVNCAWGNWVAWSVCSVTCGSGTRTRTRAKSTSASNGGKACLGLATASESCKLNACAGAVLCGPKVAKPCAPVQVCSNPDTPSAKCGAAVCGKLPAKQCTTGAVCSNPDTPSAKCGAPVCGKLPAKQCTTGKVCSNPDTPSAKCGAAVCGKLPAKQCTTSEVCSNPDTPSAKCGALVCGKLPAKQCTTGKVCSNPDTPLAKCEAPVCGELSAKQCKPLEVCSNPDTPSAKCGAAVCGKFPAKQCHVINQYCINPDTPTAKCEFHCGDTGTVCRAGSTLPSCLDAAGNTPTAATVIIATCKCTTTSCQTFDTQFQQNSTTPVCGTATNGAVTATGESRIGQCVMCRMGKDGSIDPTAAFGAGVAGQQAPVHRDSTCPAGMGCCVGGQCVAKTCPLA